MRLTKFTDYAIRVLLYSASRPDTLVTIEETADVFEISRAHLKKVVLHLSSHGYLRAVRGRGGGFSLALAPADIGLGDLVRTTESDFGLVECFLPGNHCAITPFCRLPGILDEALSAFLGTLDRYTLQDLLLTPESFVAPPGPQPQLVSEGVRGGPARRIAAADARPAATRRVGSAG
ncbi:MAG: RrF2 family transcriptional regulator [Alkalilacustris sp.]